MQELGNFAAAKPKYEEALVILQDVGDQGGAAVASSNIGDILLHGGDLRGSAKMYEQAIAILHEVGDKTNECIDLSSIGVALEALGELPAAQTHEEEALAIARETGNKFTQAVVLNNLSEVRYDRGDLPGTKNMLDQSEPLLREIGQKTALVYTLLDRGRTLLMQDDIRSAKDKYQEALTVSKETADKQGVARSQLYLGDLAVEENRPADAESLSNQALAEFRAEKDIDDEIMAFVTLARALLSTGRVSAAHKEIGQASLLTTQAVASRWEIALAAGRTESALGGSIAAKAKLEAMLNEATKASFVPYQFEARLALGEIEIKSGQASDGHARLAALEKDAIAKGFLLIARKAATAAKV
jgi:tetratricopeptide (TPR) repeat protein